MDLTIKFLQQKHDALYFIKILCIQYKNYKKKERNRFDYRNKSRSKFIRLNVVDFKKRTLSFN